MKLRKNQIFFLCYGGWVLGIVWVLMAANTGCSTPRSLTAEQRETLDALVAGREIYFDARYALPTASQEYIQAANMGFTQVRGNSVASINLQGEQYFLKIHGDSVRSFLPYFGRRYNMAQPGDRGAIEVDNVMEAFDSRNTDRGTTLEFFARNGFERFRFLVDLQPSGNMMVSVYSPQRDVIRFKGTHRFDAPN
ncbi:DUF4251 domain-containing protein [Robiginitalea sp. M366]|uniref:DUF4251 domain-containing protein n=1 Tax=Robiginitalea aestuariiviva TaxID=3036903 RepID=UPI00240D2E83|nr:DUF4251 domain-containing protein [Robiginitalea aestuariiviva]MDG1572901.1 DUF4251 domain-containing protein [Robiginitalea aestuariiviva]